MGLADATDIFELCIHQLLQDLQGVLNIADDILVFGGTREEFNSNVISFLDRCVKEDIHLNLDKVQNQHGQCTFLWTCSDQRWYPTR